MAERLTNADPGEIQIYVGGWGCAFCGAWDESAFVSCCPAGSEWSRRLAAIVFGAARARDLESEPSLEEQHRDARFARVLTRWSTKRAA